MNLKEQGINAGPSFRGEIASDVNKLVYGESVPLFSETVRDNLEPGEYTLADLGSNGGEFLNSLVSSLPDYSFNTIAIDVNADDLRFNPADHKVVSDIAELALADKSIDITFARYALAWNDLETQKKILREIKRVTRKIAIIQHQGANSERPEGLQCASKKLFSGDIPELRRNEFFFSTPDQLEGFMRELEINFSRIQNRDVDGLSNIFIEKYKLPDEDAQKVKRILSGNDYINQSTWLLEFNDSEEG